MNNASPGTDSPYTALVRQIRELNWSSLDEDDLQRLMILAAYAAQEFAQSLRLTAEQHPDNLLLQEMVGEELQTNNLSFGDYYTTGDHADFLWHFIAKHNLLAKFPDVKRYGDEYIERVESLIPEVRVMSIVSREQELPGIFHNVLTAKQWAADGLPEFKYYLERHIYLDSHEGGHADMVRGITIDNRVALFYAIRLELYRCIPKLFLKK